MFLVKVCFVLPGKRKNHQMPLFGMKSVCEKLDLQQNLVNGVFTR